MTIANLTKSNVILTNTNAALTHQVTVLQKAKQPSNPRNGKGGRAKANKLCPNCKQEVTHLSSECFELPANTAKRLNNWVSCE